MIKHCPSCGSESIELKGDRYICPDCTMIFEIKADGSAKVIDYDPLGKIVDAVIEKMKAGEKVDPPGLPAIDLSEKSNPSATDITPEKKENNDTSNAFISW